MEYEILPKIIEASEKILPECKDFKYEQQYEMVKELEKDIETKVDDILRFLRIKIFLKYRKGMQ